MKYLITILSTLLLFVNTYSQTNKLIGEIDISIKKGTITENIIITNFFEETNEFEILLSKSLNINTTYYNNKNIIIEKDTARSSFQNIYRIELNKKSNFNDTLILEISGTFKIYNDTNKYFNSSNMNIVCNYGILRAPSVTSWYPQIKSGVINEISEMYTKKYNYDITVNCFDCKYIHIGDDMPKKSPCIFKKEYAGIMLLAGSYNWILDKKNLFINIDSSKTKELNEETRKICNYYENLLKEPIVARISFVKIYSDKYDWAFYAKPTIVFMKPKNKLLNIDIGFLSHEISHNYFGNLYIPKTNLYWFYLESFAEFFSFKYQIYKNDTKSLRMKFQTLKIVSLLNKLFIKKINGYNTKFVHLDKIKQKEEITEYQRYNISPFQLLGIEHMIGEEKMIEFTKKVFSNLKTDKDGYIIMFETLNEIGINDKIIKKIKKNYFKRLKIRKYKFIKKNWL